MKKILLFLAIYAASGVLSFAQEKPKFNVKFSGFVKTDIFWDSRQTISVREGHFLLYPRNESLDINGEDINDKANFLEFVPHEAGNCLLHCQRSSI